MNYQALHMMIQKRWRFICQSDLADAKRSFPDGQPIVLEVGDAGEFLIENPREFINYSHRMISVPTDNTPYTEITHRNWFYYLGGYSTWLGYSDTQLRFS